MAILTQFKDFFLIPDKILPVLAVANIRPLKRESCTRQAYKSNIKSQVCNKFNTSTCFFNACRRKYKCNKCGSNKYAAIVCTKK